MPVLVDPNLRNLNRDLVQMRHDLSQLRAEVSRHRVDGIDTDIYRFWECNEQFQNLKAEITTLGERVTTVNEDLNTKINSLVQQTGTLNQRMEENPSSLREAVSNLQEAVTRLADLYTGQQSQIAELKREASSFRPIIDHVLEFRKRCWKNRIEYDDEENFRAQGPALSTVCKAHLDLDARMFIERMPRKYWAKFKELYGVSPEQGEALAAQECFNTLRILNVVAGLRLAKRELRPEEDDIFSRITHMMNLYDDYSEVEVRSREFIDEVDAISAHVEE